MFATITDCVGTLTVLASKQMKELAFHDTNEEVCKPGEILIEAVITMPPGVIDGALEGVTGDGVLERERE
jgi:hypothetical protein